MGNTLPSDIATFLAVLVSGSALAWNGVGEMIEALASPERNADFILLSIKGKGAVSWGDAPLLSGFFWRLGEQHSHLAVNFSP